jgi:uncharacterized protein
VLVDGQRVGEQAMPESSVARFYEVAYPLPEALLRDKQRATVKFQAAAGSEVAAVFGLRLVRADQYP